MRIDDSQKPMRLIATLAVAAMALAACGPKADDDAKAKITPTNVTLTAAQKQHITLYTVTSGAFGKTVDATGIVDFDNDQATSVIAAFSGPVTRILVNPGDHVRKGQPLAYVESADFSEAVGTYAKALATAKNARRIANTDKDLAEHKGVSAREAQQAETDAQSAEADRDAALHGLTALDIDPSAIKALQSGLPVAKVAGVIRAPIGGTVAEKLVTPGQLLQAGTTPAFTIADLSKVWVMAQIPDSDLTSVRVGDSASVMGGSTPGAFTGTVTNIAAVVNPDTRATLARVQVDNPGDLLKKQMYVRVQIRSRQQTTGILVPVASVLRDDENLPFVFIQQPDGSFARHHVTLGEREGDQYLISQGLNGGEQIINDGGVFLQFMQSQ